MYIAIHNKSAILKIHFFVMFQIILFECDFNGMNIFIKLFIVEVTIEVGSLLVSVFDVREWNFS